MGEDPEVAAALAKLAERDVVTAQHARASLEWIAGEHGMEQITQQRIQRFCWYELPLKWPIGMAEKLRVLEGLAQALDLLQLSRYAGICRSATTREVLTAYENADFTGKVAYHRACIDSGIMPPKLPEFEWGTTMGAQEAAAWSSTADFLELAVASGELVPGKHFWQARQRDLVRIHLNAPKPDGQTLAQMILNERAEMWVNVRRGETRRRILAPVTSQLLHPAALPAETADDPMPRLRWLLDELSQGIALTQTGNLNRKFVQQNADRFGWDVSRPPRTEDELFDLHELRHFARRIGLARRSGRTFGLTSNGRRIRTDPHELWHVVATNLLGGNDFTVFTGELFLALLLDADSLPYAEVEETVRRAVTEEGFRGIKTGEPPNEFAVSQAIHETSNLCRALGLFSTGGDWRDRGYGLTSTGKATAHQALRARAGSPRTSPWS